MHLIHRAWLVGALVIGVGVAVSAQEEITLTTYYPSPRGVYNELRTVGDVHIGSTDIPTARLQVMGEVGGVAFQVDDYEKTVAALAGKGVETLETNAELRQMWVGDPDGNVIELTTGVRR